MSFNRLDADVQFETDLATGKPQYNQIKNFAFPTCNAIDVAFDIVKVFADEVPVDIVVHGVRATDKFDECIDLNWLWQEINHTSLHRFDCCRCFRMAGNQGDHQIILIGRQFVLQFKTAHTAEMNLCQQQAGNWIPVVTVKLHGGHVVVNFDLKFFQSCRYGFPSVAIIDYQEHRKWLSLLRLSELRDAAEFWFRFLGLAGFLRH